MITFFWLCFRKYWLHDATCTLPMVMKSISQSSEEQMSTHNFGFLLKQLLFVFPVKTPEMRTCILSFRPCCLPFMAMGRTKEQRTWSVFSKPQSHKTVIMWSEFLNCRLKPMVHDAGSKKALVQGHLKSIYVYRYIMPWLTIAVIPTALSVTQAN